MDRFLAAAVQMNSGQDKAANLAAAERLVREAAQRGAVLIVLPELFNCLGTPQAIIDQAEPLPGPTSEAMRALAARLNVMLVAGSFAQRCTDATGVCNTSVLFGPGRRQLAQYRKIHLFDIDLPGQVTHKESDHFAPGHEVVATATSLGTLGLAICYDLRFPELFRRLADVPVDVLCLPAAFTLATGRDHWEVLLRARAIENQAYVVAANQCGRHAPGMVTYGRSMIVDPWGTVMAAVPDGQGVAVAPIDLGRIQSIRASLPCLRHRRLAGDSPLQSAQTMQPAPLAEN